MTHGVDVEEDHMFFSDFIRSLDEIIHEDPKGYDRATASHDVEHHMLSPMIQVLMCLLLNGLYDFFEEELYLDKIEENPG